MYEWEFTVRGDSSSKTRATVTVESRLLKDSSARTGLLLINLPDPFILFLPYFFCHFTLGVKLILSPIHCRKERDSTQAAFSLTPCAVMVSYSNTILELGKATGWSAQSPLPMFRAMYEVIELEVQRETEQLFLSCLLSLLPLTEPIWPSLLNLGFSLN